MPGQHPAARLERRHVTLKERLLHLAGIDPVAGLARARQTVGEHVAPGRLASQAHRHLTEIDLGLGTRLLALRHETRRPSVAGAVLRGDLAAAAGHVLDLSGVPSRPSVTSASVA